jgi:NadR type nicotinamide-nucleotide adenylyltransferase
VTVGSVGLVAGKFAPLHKGHQHLIETALAETEHVVVLIEDCAHLTPVPLGVRAQWLRDLYPALEVREAWDGPGAPPDAAHNRVERLAHRLAGRRITHVYCGAAGEAELAHALGAIERRVDPERTRFPIESAALRVDPYAGRHAMAACVYRDLVVNVVILGGPCTGKTTLVERLARELATTWMPEYGREFWARYQVERRLTPAQLVELAEQHLAREDACLAQANRVLFCDTNALTTYTWSLYYHGRASQRLTELAQAAATRYDLTFLCAADVPFEHSWDRSGEATRETLQRCTVSELHARKIPYFTLRGPLAERLATARAVLARFAKYGNAYEQFAHCAAAAEETRR